MGCYRRGGARSCRLILAPPSRSAVSKWERSPNVPVASDRVMITLRISKRYQYLVRNNSGILACLPGYSLDFGLTGGVVKTGTFNQFIRGGIAFATPLHKLAPKAQAGKHFPKQESEPKECVNGAPLCHVKHLTVPGVLAPWSWLYATLRACFCRRYTCGSMLPYFPDAFRRKCEAMPSTLFFDEFISACQRPLRRAVYASIRLKSPWLISLLLIAPYGLVAHATCGVMKDSGSSAMMKRGIAAWQCLLAGAFKRPVLPSQEASSMPPVAALFADDNHPAAGHGYGSASPKTTQIAARMGNHGAILANEFRPAASKFCTPISADVESPIPH